MEAAAAPAVAIIRRIPRTVTREQLKGAGAAHGVVVECVRLYGQRQCILQFSDPAEAAAFVEHHAAEPLVLNGKELPVTIGGAPVSHRASGSFTDAEIRREVGHALDALVRQLATAYADDQRRARRALRTRHRQALKRQRVTPAGAEGGGGGGGEAGGTICWRFVESGGVCPTGPSCTKRHELLPLSALPVERRFLLAEDGAIPSLITPLLPPHTPTLTHSLSPSLRAGTSSTM